MAWAGYRVTQLNERKETGNVTFPEDRNTITNKTARNNAPTFHRERSAHHRYVYEKCRHIHHGRSYNVVKFDTKLLNSSFLFQLIISHHLPALGRHITCSTFWNKFYSIFLTVLIMVKKSGLGSVAVISVVPHI